MMVGEVETVQQFKRKRPGLVTGVLLLLSSGLVLFDGLTGFNLATGHELELPTTHPLTSVLFLLLSVGFILRPSSIGIKIALIKIR